MSTSEQKKRQVQWDVGQPTHKNTLQTHIMLTLYLCAPVHAYSHCLIFQLSIWLTLHKRTSCTRNKQHLDCCSTLVTFSSAPENCSRFRIFFFLSGDNSSLKKKKPISGLLCCTPPLTPTSYGCELCVCNT